MNDALLSEDFIQQEMAKIAVMKGLILRVIEQPVSTSTVPMLRDYLRGFHVVPPSWMKFSHLTSAPDISSSLRIVVFYVHLFYMSTIILLHRFVLRNIKNLDRSLPICANAQEGHIAAE